MTLTKKVDIFIAFLTAHGVIPGGKPNFMIYSDPMDTCPWVPTRNTPIFDPVWALNATNIADMLIILTPRSAENGLLRDAHGFQPGKNVLVDIPNFHLGLRAGPEVASYPDFWALFVIFPTFLLFDRPITAFLGDAHGVQPDQNPKNVLVDTPNFHLGLRAGPEVAFYPDFWAFKDSSSSFFRSFSL